MYVTGAEIINVTLQFYSVVKCPPRIFNCYLSTFNVTLTFYLTSCLSLLEAGMINAAGEPIFRKRLLSRQARSTPIAIICFNRVRSTFVPMIFRLSCPRMVDPNEIRTLATPVFSCARRGSIMEEEATL